MSSDLVDTVPRMEYVDRHELLRSLLTTEEFRERRQEQLNYSATVYVGNLSFYTTEEQVYNHFSPCGHIRDIVMGLNEATRCPCGFCFVVFESQAAAVLAVHGLDGSLLDDRVVSVSWDVGCDGSRRWGRGAHGGQVVDGVRQNLDEGRGGLGALRRDALGVPASTAEDELVAYDWVEAPPKRRGAHTK
ncbi:nuclear cap binding protein [Leishmania donovani]|uniref:Nuclear cap-binding protein subunit 2 n=3 Tax=Leishmania donovani species complex TaxID=38574 RepID=A0A6L0XV91_LEIIN|nr:putative nuclear cap binding protein [Leishmania infantum JPCM5]XP_003862770.1 nuclear cap binding protein, putative [Leishmania donovani]CAC9512102.1 nuclear_cap_binding_protein_-_putative [Leishmania infantum]TPP43451.1 RNA recognition motif family protein [Leishmania donovani]TPP45625.1 RNA recognition motif family protein [Leishmania donovani]CAJ1990838.1 nuclear cap binding protein [Leishmania donovani]CAM69950.1 putative nuclear cap binding protein [Leishmania infantum JPCM5]|eukprot:XP_001466901.1 putative nuclear cap binding protein [Leishmania infantum JPCM5]